MATVVPPSLGPVSTYFERADELQKAYPFVSHHLRLFGVELSMKMKRTDAGRFLMAQMDILEAQKQLAQCTTPPTVQQAVPAPAPDAPAPAAPAAETTPVDISDGEQHAHASTDKKGEPQDKDASSSANPASPSPPPAAASEAPAAPPTVTYRTVQQTPQDALRTVALSIYERSRAADDPKRYPSPSTKWGVVDAPTVARGLHAAAVILDAIKRFEPTVPAELEPFQRAAHRRSMQLSSQIANAFKTSAPVRLDWAPVVVSAPFASFTPPPARTSAHTTQAAQEDVAAMFPSVPGQPGRP